MRSPLPKLLLLSAFTFSMLFSCKKNDVQDQLPVTLALQSFMPKGDFRVFSKEGEITDPASIATFIQTSVIQNVSYTFGPQQNAGRDLTFINDTAFRIGQYEYYTYSKISDGILCKKVDYATNYSFDAHEARFTPFLKYPEMTYNSNGSVTFQKRFAGYGDKLNLRFPGVDLVLKKRDDATGEIIGNFGLFGNWNEFNPEGLKQLGQRDTLVIRETISNYTAK